MSVVVLVCGGREYSDSATLFDTLDALHEQRRIRYVVQGGARGADYLAFQWATTRGVATVIHAADWKRRGKRAGPLRNQEMLDNWPVALVVAFPGGTGTADMVGRAVRAGIEVIHVGSSLGSGSSAGAGR